MTTETTNAMREAREAAEGGPVSTLIERLAERIGARASVEAVFGRPIQQGDTTVVPVARVRWGVGGGEGQADQASSGRAAGSGSGAGGGVAADPIGYLVIRPDGAEFQPIGQPFANPVFLLAAGIAAALVIRSLGRLIRR
jgi:uncharacterized spore protein YtfJ